MLGTRINALTLVLLIGVPVYAVAGLLGGGGSRSTAFFVVAVALLILSAARIIRAR